jgi:hypothetical protein
MVELERQFIQLKSRARIELGVIPPVRRSSARGVTIYEPNGDSGYDFLQGLVDDAKARGLNEVKIKGIDDADRASLQR